MCRWFCYISDGEPCLLEDVLVTPQHALTKQVNEHYLPKLFHHEDGVDDRAVRADIKARNIFFNQDGTGVGFYTSVREEYGEANGPRPMVYKTIQPPVNDLNLQYLVRHTSSPCVFAHIRMATSAVHFLNNHPFAFGRHLFMHNGAVSSFTDIRRDMCALMTHKAFANVLGSTDSEHVAALYMTYLAPDDDWDKTYSAAQMKRALDKAIGMILRLQRKLIGTAASDAIGANSLNLCATDGASLVAVRFRNHATEQPPSLYYSTSAGVTLNRKYPGDAEGSSAHEDKSGKAAKEAHEHGKHVIVASEPTTYHAQEWELIPKNTALIVESNMTFRLEPVNTNAEAEGV